MIELEGLPSLCQPTLIAAFEDWNDAAEGDTGVVDHLLSLYGGTTFAEIDSEDYYEFQVNRPVVAVGERGVCTLRWPGTENLASIPFS